MHYYIDIKTRKKEILPDNHLKRELDIIPVINGTWILIDCSLLNDTKEIEHELRIDSNEIPFLKDKNMTSTVPNNQKISWYKTALDNYGRGNGGESKDYDLEELKAMYYKKCSQESEKMNKELDQMSSEIMEVLPPVLPLVLPILKFDILYDEITRMFLQIPMIINY